MFVPGAYYSIICYIIYKIDFTLSYIPDVHRLLTLYEALVLLEVNKSIVQGVYYGEIFYIMYSALYNNSITFFLTDGTNSYHTGLQNLPCSSKIIGFLPCFPLYFTTVRIRIHVHILKRKKSGRAKKTCLTK